MASDLRRPREVGLERKSAESLVETRRRINLDAEVAKLDAANVRAHTWADDSYPERLREVADSPPVLYMLGEIVPADSWAVGVVGTRRVTSYGREATSRLSAGLAEAGITIVSGLPPSTVSAVLIMMELKGMVRHLGGMQYAAR